MFDLCGIGNACIDIVASVDDDFLRDRNLQKGICTYLTLDPANLLESELPDRQYIPGGCAANVAACISALGGTTSFIGRTAADSIGGLFMDDLKKRGIRYTGIPDTTPGAGSTRVFVLITPDTERTFASYYGVQEDLSESDLDIDAIKQSRFLYLDGYALNSRIGADAFIKAATLSHAAGQLVVFSPNDLSILTKYGDAVARMMAVADIILCNETEALSLTGQDNLPAALTALQSRFAAGAVTAGQSGSYAFDGDTIHHALPHTPDRPVIDTNGAGDHFAGGFLYGLAHGFSVEKSAALGNLCATAIITEHGARPVSDYKPLLTLLG